MEEKNGDFWKSPEKFLPPLKGGEVVSGEYCFSRSVLAHRAQQDDGVVGGHLIIRAALQIPDAQRLCISIGLRHKDGFITCFKMVDLAPTSLTKEGYKSIRSSCFCQVGFSSAKINLTSSYRSSSTFGIKGRNIPLPILRYELRQHLIGFEESEVIRRRAGGRAVQVEIVAAVPDLAFYCSKSEGSL